MIYNNRIGALSYYGYKPKRNLITNMIIKYDVFVALQTCLIAKQSI